MANSGDPEYFYVTLGDTVYRSKNACSHLENMQEVTASAERCDDCLRAGDTWVHLRLCMECGYVGCCEQSKNQHARNHSQGSGHAIIRSIEAGENWMWCYPDETFITARKVDS